MSSNWNYVIAGYTITTGMLAGYVVWLKIRGRRLRRTLTDDGS